MLATRDVQDVLRIAGPASSRSPPFDKPAAQGPIDDPQIVDGKLHLHDPAALASIGRRLKDIVDAQVLRIDTLWSDMIAGEIGFDRWPLDAGRLARSKTKSP